MINNVLKRETSVAEELNGER